MGIINQNNMKFYASAIVLALFLNTTEASHVDVACPGDNDARLKSVLEALAGPPAPSCGCSSGSSEEKPAKKAKSSAKSVKKAIEKMEEKEEKKEALKETKKAVAKVKKEAEKATAKKRKGS